MLVAMLTVPMDETKVRRCRELAASVADDVQRYIDGHTSVGVERTILRAYGVDGVDDQGAPLVNLVVDRYAKAGLLGRGISFFLGRALLAGAKDLQDAAERLAYGPDLDRGEGGPDANAVLATLDAHTQRAVARIDTARDEREANKARSKPGGSPLKYVIVATGNIYDDALQAKAAAYAGADIVAVIRATAQSLLDYVPHGATTEGYGGTFATQENFKIIRRATDEAALDYGRYIHQTNYSSGLCMAEIAWMGAVERLDMLLNDAMYGILFRDINPCRNFVDQYVSRRIIARSGIVINTGEDNYLTTADAVEKAHTVLASQFVNEAFAKHAGVKDEQMGLGHAYEIDPSIENSFLLELAQAQLIRQVFPTHPIKWMPPTKFKTGDIFQSHVHDAMFSLVGVTTHQSIQLLGMFSEAVHNPMLMDRYLALKATKYVFDTARSLGDEISIKPDGIMAKRAEQVLDEALELLAEVEGETIWKAIERGAFADVKRTRTGGKGYAGVFERSSDYVNPILTALEASA
jgi:beta-lysine 5,6-aminomutase alpha subunit